VLIGVGERRAVGGGRRDGLSSSITGWGEPLLRVTPGGVSRVAGAVKGLPSIRPTVAQQRAIGQQSEEAANRKPAFDPSLLTTEELRRMQEVMTMIAVRQGLLPPEVMEQ